jgi:hypothetical protein
LATGELNGYSNGELPHYRKITAPLKIDGNTMHGISEGISPLLLPDFVRERVGNEFPLTMGIAEIEKLARRHSSDKSVKLQFPMAADIVLIMNGETTESGAHKWQRRIHSIYWDVSIAALEGVVDQVRTALTVLVAEITAAMPDGVDTPSPAVATSAVNFLVTGDRYKINFSAPQAGTALTTPPPDEHPRRWLRTAAAVVIGIAGLVGVFFAILQVQGWSF